MTPALRRFLLEVGAGIFLGVLLVLALLWAVAVNP